MGETKPGPFKIKTVPVTGRMGTVADQKCPKPNRKQCPKQKQCAKPNMSCLPKGLVGSSCTVVVNIAGLDFHCLMDTSSQVTTVPLSFYQQILSDQPLKPLCDLLEVEGAAGQSIPYLGYVEMTVRFPNDFVGTDIDIPTLALVVPDIHLEAPSPVLIGTNTLDVLYDHYFGKTTHQPSQYGYRAVLKTLELRQQQNRDGSIGVVRMLSKTPTIIPACCSVILEGSAKVHSPSPDRLVIIEHPTQSYLPGGLSVKSCLTTLPSMHLTKFL